MRVLLLEDEQAQADCLAMILGDAGYSMAVAYDVPQALESARSRRPDIVLTDLCVKGASGLECLLRLYEELGPIQTIVITGLPRDHQTVVDAIKQLHCQVMQKPVDIGSLLSLMKSPLLWLADGERRLHAG
ncbi:N/A [soil metagenome]